MNSSRRRAITILAGAVAGGMLPSRTLHAAEIRSWRGIALGAPASLTIAGLAPVEADGLIAAARAEIDRLEDVFSLHRPDSALCRLNRDGALDVPPADLLVLLSRSAAIHAATDGAFDPTVQPVWRLLAETAGVPDPEVLGATLALVGWEGVSVEPGSIRFARPKMALTLNGIAQGYVTDRVAEILRREGVRSVLVEIGEIAANGPAAPGEPWRIGIADSGDEPAEEDILLASGAIATSAPLGTTFDSSRTAGHILHPTRGTVPSPWRRISVLHRSATVADGLSTGLVLTSPDRLQSLLARQEPCRVIAVDINGKRIDLST